MYLSRFYDNLKLVVLFLFWHIYVGTSTRHVEHYIFYLNLIPSASNSTNGYNGIVRHGWMVIGKGLDNIIFCPNCKSERHRLVLEESTIITSDPVRLACAVPTILICHSYLPICAMMSPIYVESMVTWWSLYLYSSNTSYRRFTYFWTKPVWLHSLEKSPSDLPR